MKSAVLPGVILVLVCGWLLVDALGWKSSRPPTPLPPPARNVVIIMIDTLRSDELLTYGHPEDLTPFLSKLADEGIQLQGHSASSWTRPSVATFLTGLYPQRHQAVQRDDHLPPEAPFLPELLRARGWHTGAFITNGNIGKEVGFGRGWEVYEEWDSQGKPDAKRVTDVALRIASELKPPLLLYVHYLDPHDPYVPEKVWGMPDVRPEHYVQPRDFNRRKYPLDGPEFAQMRAQYEGEIHEMDRGIRRLVEGLGDLGLLTNTLVVVTADHGEEFGEHGMVAHGHHLHAEVVEVPFILWMESGFPRRRSATPFHHVDFVPTLLEAVGEPSVRGLDGRSRWRELLQSDPEAPDVELFHLDLDHFGEIAIRKDERKLILRVPDRSSFLYDLTEDPAELRPLGIDDGVSTRAALLDEVVRRHNDLSEAALPRTSKGLSPDLTARLAALGYASPDGAASKRVVPPHLESAPR